MASHATSEDAKHPWDLAAQPRPFEETCFADFQDGSGGLSEEEANRWLEAVEDRPLALVESNNEVGQAVTLKGLAKLRLPWVPDAALRLSLQSDKPFMLHFCQGRQGVALRYYPSGYGHSWVAYRTMRRPHGQMTIGDEQLVAADPDFALLATDGRQSGRTAGGTYRIQHQQGTLVMTKGDFRLLTVPMAAPPAEVYFESEATLLRELAAFRSGPVPETPIRKRTVVVRGDRPASLRWQENLAAGARLRRFPDGRVQLAAKNPTEPSFARVPLIRNGLYEVILEVEEPSPGTAVYLADDRGRPVQAIGYFRDPDSGRTYFAYDLPDVQSTAGSPNIDTAAAPYVGRRQHLRLVLGGGTMKCFAGSDGVHWREALQPRRDLSGTCSQIGLYSRPGKQTQSITLRRLEVRRLDALTAVAPVELLERAKRLQLQRRDAEQVGLGAWRQTVWESQAAGTDAAAWRRACAVGALIGGAGQPLANALIEGLIEDVRCSSAPLEDKLRFLQDAALIYDGWGKEDALWLAAGYGRLGQDQLRDVDRPCFSAVHRALMSAPLWPDSDRVDATLAGVARTELLTLVARREWPAVRRFCRQLRFWNQPARLSAAWPNDQQGLQPLVGWAEDVASRGLPLEQNDQVAAAPAEWRHPLIVYLGKEAYNVQAELAVALREESYRMACQILTSTSASRGWGLVVDNTDERLFVSLPTAVAQAMREHPLLRKTLDEQFSDVSRIRLRQAMADSDVAAIRGATVQYYGTPVAAEAHCWLGDRFMADGQFAPAIGCYRQAVSMETATRQYQLSARIRLAAAMLGQEMGSPATGPVDFNDFQMTARQFEELVTVMREQHSAGAAVSPNGEAVARTDAAPPPARFAPQPWAVFQGDVGTSPANVPSPIRELDWPARQIAAVTANGVIVVANRFQVVAYEPDTGRIKWTHSLGDRQGPTHDRSLVRMWPRVCGNRVYARMLTKDSRAEIVCLDLASGKQLWTNSGPRYIVSDPLVIHGQVFVLSVDSGAGRPTSQLILTSLDPVSGIPLSEELLAEFRGRWNNELTCRATIVDERIVAAIAGSVLCCDTFGQLHWVRQDTWVPPSLDPGRRQASDQPPIVAGSDVYVIHPALESIDCIDLETGRINWHRAMPGLRCLLELIDEKLLIETDRGIRAIAARDGHGLWLHKVEHLLDGYLATREEQSRLSLRESTPFREAKGDYSGLLYVKREPIGGERWCPVLVWLDAETGQPQGSCPLTSLAAKQPAVGPLLARDDRLWCFTGTFDDQGKLQPQRNILELVAKGPVNGIHENTTSPWTSTPGASRQLAVAVALPGWSMLSTSRDEKTGLQAELAGKPDVLVTKAADTPTRLARRLSLPQGGTPRLLIEIGHDAETTSKVEIRAGGLPLLQLTPPTTTAAQQWQQLEVDLSAHAGKDVWITIVQEQAGDAPAYMYWKRLEVLP